MKTLNYKAKTFSQIFKNLISTAYSKGLLSEDENYLQYINNLEDIDNMYVLFLSTYAKEIESIYEDMTLIYNAYDVEKATGNDLDLIGEKFNIPRPTAQKSSAEIVFSISKPISEDIVIPIGSEVETKNEEVYYTIEETVLVAGSLATKCQSKSVTTGYNSRVSAGELNTVFSNLHTGLRVTNPKDSSGGRNASTDKEYRVLIKQWAYSHNRGTKEAYDLFFRYFEGLDGYKLIPLWDGTGTVKVVIDPGTDYMVYTIQSLLAENVEMFDDDVLVVGATEKQIDINANVNVTIDSVYDYSKPEKDNIKLRVENNIRIYVDGGYKTNGEYYTGLSLGEDFIPYKCGVFLDSQVPELKNINFSNDFVSIGEDEKCVSGSIVVTVE